jgi:hypothetical protein
MGEVLTWPLLNRTYKYNVLKSRKVSMKGIRKKFSIFFRDNEDGFVMVGVLLGLALITILGVMATKTTTCELQISTNDQIYKSSFYAAEAARAFVVNSPDLYGSTNLTTGAAIHFPDATDSSVAEPLGSMAMAQSYNGEVEYLRDALPPRGSGYQVGKFRSHIYQMICVGHGPRGSEASIEAGFYRIGF